MSRSIVLDSSKPLFLEYSTDLPTAQEMMTMPVLKVFPTNYPQGVVVGDMTPYATIVALEETNDEVALKADAAFVNSALNLKADETSVNTALALKADTVTMVTALGLKASTSAVELKADTTTMNAALAMKADTTAMNAALALKSDASAVDAALALKANSTVVNTALALKEDKTTVASGLALKLNLTGGTVSGNLAINGGFSVATTATSAPIVLSSTGNVPNNTISLVGVAQGGPKTFNLPVIPDDSVDLLHSGTTAQSVLSDFTIGGKLQVGWRNPVNDIVTSIGASPTDAQLVTGLGIKSYVDGNSASGLALKIDKTAIVTGITGESDANVPSEKAVAALIDASYPIWSEPRGSSLQWADMCSSKDGRVLYACCDNYAGNSYRSMDYGNTWILMPNPGIGAPWKSIACSSSGQFVYMIPSGGGFIIWRSDDYGTTLTGAGPNKDWDSICCDASGRYVTVVAPSYPVYSTDYGVSFYPGNYFTFTNMKIACDSSTGKKIVGIVAGGQIFTSTDQSAGTWTARESARAWTGIGSNYDGTRLIASASGGQLYTSSDSGVTWTPREKSRSWLDVASSYSGRVLIASTTTSNYISHDYGVSWAKRNTTSGNFTVVTVSGDGCTFGSAISPGYIYMLREVGSTGPPENYTTMPAVAPITVDVPPLVVVERLVNAMGIIGTPTPVPLMYIPCEMSAYYARQYIITLDTCAVSTSREAMLAGARFAGHRESLQVIGGSVTSWNLSSTQNPSLDWGYPEITYDGTRFVVSWTGGTTYNMNVTCKIKIQMMQTKLA